jgi:2,5-furandicarboxylate decarboxylase 1
MDRSEKESRPLRRVPVLSEGFRDFLARLLAANQLTELRQPVDPRHIATLTDQGATALWFARPIGYDMPVVSGLVRTRERMLLAAGCETMQALGARFATALERPIAPETTPPAADRIRWEADAVDLFRLPVPMSSVHDGAPTITAGVVLARDPEYGLNAGVYRLMLRDRNTTGIDIVTPNNLRLFAERALAENRPLPISVSIGVHPLDAMGAGYRSPAGVNELGIAGGLRGAPVALAPCETIDLPYLADAEIVLEAEILPTGWTYPEGRFGEFTRLMGGLHWNPLVRVKAISLKPDAVYYALHMPWENVWLGAPTRYTAIAQSLRAAGVVVKDINVTLGGCAFWHAVISIRKSAGEGKNALLAALSVMDLKQVIVVDEDIDVFDPVEVEFAVATRVQADRDVIVVAGARAKPLDPSLPPGKGVPTGAKLGIDATIPEGVPRERFERITYAYGDTARIADYLAGRDDAPGTPVPDLAANILAALEDAPLYYSALVETFATVPFAQLARTMGALQESGKLWQDSRGRICRRGSRFDAVPP